MGRKPKDLTGQRFGKLTAVALTDERKQRFVVWECRCDCGRTVLVRMDQLRSGKINSCGCERQKDLTGLRFGKLTVLRQAKERKNGCIVWECLCDCGNTTFATWSSLMSGGKQSCGCRVAEGMRKTGKSNAKDLTGQRFGKLVAVRPTEQRLQTFVIWECLCDCGKTHYVASGNLIHGKVKSCGCVKPNQPKGLTNKQAKDLTGQRFGKLVAVGPTERRENRYIVWECLCDCGNTYFTTSGNLAQGHVKSCGCLSKGRKYGDNEPKDQQGESSL